MECLTMQHIRKHDHKYRFWKPDAGRLRLPCFVIFVRLGRPYLHSALLSLKIYSGNQNQR